MKRMKLLLFFLGSLACAAELTGVHKVYVMPMPRGLDQYLANRLVGEHVFQVVTDRKLADAVFTDRLGEGFESQLDEISPTKTTEPVAKPADNSNTISALGGDTVNKLSNPAQNSSFGRSRGTLFLVDAKSRAIVWSIYDPPKGVSGKQLDHIASDIVSRLKKDLNPKKPQTADR
jgi:hypothetical protein